MYYYYHLELESVKHYEYEFDEHQQTRESAKSQAVCLRGEMAAR